MRDEEMKTILENREMESDENAKMVRAKRMGSIEEVVEEVGVLIDTHFNEFTETKSSQFLKKVFENQSSIDMRHFTRTWR